MVNILGRTKEILSKDKDARNNDNMLIWDYWAEFDDPTGLIRRTMYALGRKKIMFELTSPESIRRSRQKIQNEMGWYKPTPSVMEKRIKKQEAMRKTLKSQHLSMDEY